MADELQFDRADYAAPQPLACRGCQAAIPVEYYAVNGQVLCRACADGLRPRLGGTGSGMVRIGQAMLLGAGAALLGTAVYAGVMIFTNSEWALISIGIGWLVGQGVRKGSGNRGGWQYQVLAAFLTYTAICAAYAAVAWYSIGSPSPEQIARIALRLYTLPFLDGFGNVIGWLIIGFGMWQAWQLNRPSALTITGPHALGTGPQATAAARV